MKGNSTLIVPQDTKKCGNILEQTEIDIILAAQNDKFFKKNKFHRCREYKFQ